MQRKLLVFPDDTIQPVIDAIAAAEQSIQVKMFLFTDVILFNALVSAQKRGVQVRVMLNPSRSNGEAPNEIIRQQLIDAGIEVRDTHAAFKVTHEKSMVIDGSDAFIFSLNWASRHMVGTRDFAVITKKKKEVQEITDCFERDWEGTEFNPGDTAHLVWCPANGRLRIAHFIDNAKHSLLIQNDRYHDLVIIERLIRAAKRGVKVHLLSPPPHALKKDKIVEGIGGLSILHDMGIKVHTLKHLHLHAKLLLADGARAMVGSINLSTGSLDERRELAIELDDEPIIERLNEITHYDWKHSEPIDFSDEGLYNELQHRGSGGAEKLVLKKGK